MTKIDDRLLDTVNRLYLVGIQLEKSIRALELEESNVKSKKYASCVERKWLRKILYKDLAVTYRALINESDSQSLFKLVTFLQAHHDECQYLDRIKEKGDDKIRLLRQHLKKQKQTLIHEKVIVENWINAEITHFGEVRNKNFPLPMGGNVWNAAKMALGVLFDVDYLVTGRRRPTIKCPILE